MGEESVLRNAFMGKFGHKMGSPLKGYLRYPKLDKLKVESLEATPASTFCTKVPGAFAWPRRVSLSRVFEI